MLFVSAEHSVIKESALAITSSVMTRFAKAVRAVSTEIV